MNEVVANPFGARTVGTASSSTAVSLQSREVAEIQTKYLMAQRFPRDMIAVTDAILNAFTRPSLAEQAEYEYARGGQAVTGPTIRTAEAMAQQYQNIDFGFREVGRGLHDDGVPYSDVEAYAIDLQNRSRRAVTFVVRHWRDTKKGGYVLKDERDINELVSNQAQRRVRSCILAIIPGDITEAAMKQVAVTLSANADTTPDGIAKMVKAFAKFDVTPAQIEKRIQRRLEAIQPAQVISLLKVFNSLKDGMSTVEDWFEPVDAAAGAPVAAKTTSVKDLKDKAKAAPAPAAAAPTPIEGEEVAGPAAAPPAAAGDTGTAPATTFAAVNDALLKAETLEALDDAATLIDAVGNRGHQKELNTVYADRRAALGGD